LMAKWQEHSELGPSTIPNQTQPAEFDCIHWIIPGPIIMWIEAMLDAIFCQKQTQAR
jgi:hypothetical protein